jgi:X-Pro dipeptidyl-peptidase
VENGVTQPVFPFANAIEEIVFVESEVDSDGDGRLDRVRIRISRPGETESQGIKVPVVFEHSPYRGDLGDAVNHNVDLDRLPQEVIGKAGAARAATARSNGRARAKARAAARTRADLPGQLDNYYVPRGYAVVLGESLGTFDSDGCPDVGGPVETLGTKAVIDWLNGRARGWNEAGEPVRADWTTGAVGMVGVSYNGTLPNQVATTGVEGLETIIPISAISSWYDYYRANGLVVAPHSETQGVGENEFLGEDTDVLGAFIGGPRMTGRCAHVLEFLNRAQDRVTGDYSPFWRARDYLSRVGGVEASVFVVHGLNDWNGACRARSGFTPAATGRPAGTAPPSTSSPRTAGSTTGCSGSRTGSPRSRGRRSSARTAPITRRPTGPRRAHASRGCTSRRARRPRPATSRPGERDAARTRASSTGAASSTRTTC